MQTSRWGTESLWHQLEPLLPGLSIEVVARTDSTNTQLIERARMHMHRNGDGPSGQGRRAGDTQPCLLVAEHQTGGRGREGRQWRSAPGPSLTFSLALPIRRADWSGLSLAVGVALAEALDPTSEGSLSLRLKWPNDLMLVERESGHARKLGGILIESVAVGAQRLAVIGVGLNVLPMEIGDAQTGFACLQELHGETSPPQALAQIGLPLVQSLLQFGDAGFLPFVQRYAARDLLRGTSITTTLADLPEGMAEGVDNDGALLVRSAHGLRRVVSGEVSVRLASQPALAPAGSSPGR
jgi:BirA family biotin operon repressor/biotin-[acetyl-CoA-carboxylase] ligase